MSRDKLNSVLVNSLSQNLNESYFGIQATNRGIWGGMSSLMKTQDKYIAFKTRDVAQQYLDDIHANESNVNNFNSYGIVEISEDEINNNFVVVDSLADLRNKSAELKNNKLKQREQHKQIILDLQSYIEELLKPNEDLYSKSEINLNHSGVGYNELTVYLRSKIYHEDNYKDNDLYINIEITSDEMIKLYYGSKQYFKLSEVDTVKNKVKEYIDRFNSAQKD